MMNDKVDMGSMEKSMGKMMSPKEMEAKCKKETMMDDMHPKEGMGPKGK